MQLLSGSAGEAHKSITPFDQARDNATTFIVNMSSCMAFETLAQRIGLLNALLALPVMSSSQASTIDSVETATKKMYKNEMQEIETVIKIYCSLPGTPEA